MADPTTKTFDQLVEGQAAAVQARAAGLVDFSIGAIVLAVVEAASGVGLWLQGLVLTLLATIRAATSAGPDLDSWIADWGAAPASGDTTLIARFPPTAATGQVTFSRTSTTSQVVVPVGVTVETLDGSQSYAVGLDATNPAYNAGLAGYVMAIGTASVTVPVTAQTAGAAGNAVAGAVDTITSAIPGVDAVTNALTFTGGADAETDAALLARFRSLVAAFGQGTAAAVKYAVQNLQRGVTCAVVQNLNHDGSSHPGYFYVLVDDGTGSPPSSLLTAAGVAVDAVHAAGIPFDVYAPSVVSINVTATLVTATGASHSAATTAATSALKTYLNMLPIQATVYWSRIWQLLQDASPDILEVTGLSVNSGTSDVTMTTNQVAKAGTVTIS